MKRSGQRLRQLMAEREMDQQALATAVGCTQGAISQILSGKSVRSKFLPDIASHFGVSLPWLLGATKIRNSTSGTAPNNPKIKRLRQMIDDAKPDQVSAMISYLARTSEDLALPAELSDNEQCLVGVPCVDLADGKPAAGVRNSFNGEVRYFDRRWLREITATAEVSLSWARGEGESMSPTINDSDMLLIDHSQFHIRSQDRIWAFRIGEICMIKRLRIRGDCITILSDNPEVPDDHARVDEVSIVGRVVHLLRRL